MSMKEDWFMGIIRNDSNVDAVMNLNKIINDWRFAYEKAWKVVREKERLIERLDDEIDDLKCELKKTNRNLRELKEDYAQQVDMNARLSSKLDGK